MSTRNIKTTTTTTMQYDDEGRLASEVVVVESTETERDGPQAVEPDDGEWKAMHGE